MAPALSSRRLPVLPLLGLVVALLAVAAAIGLTWSERSANRWVAHSIRSQVAIVQLRSSVIQYESAFRGYLVRPLPSLLDDIAAARTDSDRALAALAGELADNPHQIARLARLKPILARKFAYGPAFIAAVHQGRLADQLKTMKPGTGRQLTVDFMRETSLMLAEEDRLLAERTARSERLSFLLSSGLAAAVVFVVVAALLTIGDARSRFQTMEAAHDDAVAARNAVAAEAARRETAEAELRQVQKMESIGQLTGGIAHDFNNMLAVVIGGLDMARRRIGHDPIRATASIDTALEGAERAAALVARLLAFARRQPLAPVTVDVNRLVAGMSDLLRRSLGEQVEIRTRFAGDLWHVFVDAGQLENALLNLAVNARDAMERSPVRRLAIVTENVHLDAEAVARSPDVMAGDYVAVAVEDSGSGMDEATVARAFEPFFTTKEVGRGTGMGLAQAFGFVKQSHGHIRIDSASGIGTVVTLYLPRHDARPIEPAASIPARAMPTGGQDEVILVVEDEERVRHYSVEALRELGYTVISVPNGRDALSALTVQPKISLLFTDMVMPGMSGRELAEAALARRPGLRVLFTSGYAPDLIDGEGPVDAAIGLLGKPFTISQLAARIRETLDQP